MKVQPRELLIYRSANGKLPFEDWMRNLRTIQARANIRQRLNRVYFGEDGPAVIVLLLGGDKNSQARDIKMAQLYWHDYLANLGK